MTARQSEVSCVRLYYLYGRVKPDGRWKLVGKYESKDDPELKDMVLCKEVEHDGKVYQVEWKVVKKSALEHVLREIPVTFVEFFLVLAIAVGDLLEWVVDFIQGKETL